MSVDMATRAKGKVADTKHTVQVKSDEIKQQVGAGADALQAKTAKAVSKTNKLTKRVRGRISSPGNGGIKPVMNTVRRRALPSAAVGVMVFLILRLVWRRLFGRNH
jgi:hypothetical protein